MTVLPSDLNYINKDRADLLRRLQSLIDSSFPNWTEKSRANFGNILIE